MSSFGQSHRQLVQDTNAGNIIPDQAVQKSASFTADKQRQAGDTHQLAQALVDVAGTAAAPAIEEKKRRDERDAYAAAGEAEGRQAADAAADVWHNKLFGPNASLQGAQRRIAEDNARNLYLQAQDLLENGGADSWDDETWNEWKNEQIENEVNKYDSRDMKDHINSTMSQDFQKLERDRGYLHNQYKQAENRNTTLNSLNTIAKTYNTDRASSNPNRSEADSVERLEEINRLKKESGMSEKAFASAVAQIAGEEYSKGRDDFGKFAKENGYFDDLDYEVQEQLEAAQRIHEIKHDEEFNDQHNAIFGPRGYIAQGATSKALEAFDALAAEYPEAIPPGGRNQIKNQVQQQAWANAERNRIQQERIAIGKDNARTGNWQAQITYDWQGNVTGANAYSEEEKLMYTQMYIAEELENKFHANKLRDNPNYERVPMTPQERQQNYANNSQFVGQVMQQSGVMLPEVKQLASHSMSSINHNLGEMDALQQEALLNDLNALESTYKGNPAVKQMMSEQLGADFGKIEFIRNGLASGKTTQELEKAIAQGRGPDGSGPGIAGVNSKAAASRGFSPDVQASRRDSKEMLSRVREGMGEGGFLFWGKLTDTTDVENTLGQYYAEELTNLGSTSRSAKDIAMSNAVTRVQNEGAIIKTGNGKEFVPDAGQFQAELQQKGYKNIDEYLDELGSNEAYMDDVRAASGVNLKTWNPFKNPLTSDGAMVVPLDDGRMQLVIPREGDVAYTRYLEVPDAPQHIAETQARVATAMEIIDTPEWTEATGRQTPRQELDASLNKRYVQMNYPLVSSSERAKLEKEVTQEQRDKILDPELYEHALIQRQQLAAEKGIENASIRKRFQDWLNRP